MVLLNIYLSYRSEIGTVLSMMAQEEWNIGPNEAKITDSSLSALILFDAATSLLFHAANYLPYVVKE